MQTMTDQTGRTFHLDTPPRRIISTVPSQTELLAYLGLEEEVVGITKFCVHPSRWFHSKKRVGGTKNLNVQAIRQLNPDLILANKEENTREQVEALIREHPVWISDVNDLAGAYDMIRSVGTICNREAEAMALVTDIRDDFRITQAWAPIPHTAYLIWREPYMAAGGGTFIDSMMQAAGLVNMFRDIPRYPSITVADLAGDTGLPPCRLLLLSSEPYPFAEKHVAELRASLPDTMILLVDGELFSWYGSRLLQAPRYFHELRTRIGAV